MITYTPSSEKIVHETSVDFKKRPVVEPIHIVQYDSSLPIVAVTLYSDYELYPLPSSASANIKVKKPDGKFVYNEVLGCNSDRTVVYFEVTTAMTSVYGELYSVIEITIDEGIAASANISIIVDKNPVQSGDIESTYEYTELTKYAESAAASAKAAAVSESNAKASESNASASAIAAANSETNAEVFAIAAEKSENNAKEYAEAAETAEKNGQIVSIAKTSTDGLVDTYTITLYNGEKFYFKVTNGADGADGDSGTDGKDGSDGADGAQGEQGVGISSIAKTSTDGLVDTYTILLTDGTKYNFTVTNGQDGADVDSGTATVESITTDEIDALFA